MSDQTAFAEPLRTLRRLAGALGVCLGLLLAVAPAGRAADAFVAGFEDLPLMPALAQAAGSVTMFDSPYGRITESYASGRTTAQAVLAFYAETLPQLGWTRSGEASFRREGQELTLDISTKGTVLTVRFQGAPAN